MVSPQTQSRNNKIKLLKETISLASDLLATNKHILDDLDTRNLKKIVAWLKTE